jgi:hypothetical protein
MTEDQEIETYISISRSHIGIYLLDIKNLKNLYKQEITFNNEEEKIDLNNLNKFLEENIFKIEKLLGKFIKNICLIIEDYEKNNIHFGLKRKIYDEKINKNYLENLLTDAKDLFKENYQTEKIMHMIIDKYIVDDVTYFFFPENLKGKNFCFELHFKSVSISFANEVEKILEKYQIEISNYIDGNYVKNLFVEEDFDLDVMAHKVQKGFNENEVKLIPKNLGKIGFFEKFFQLFS